jgi:hypothetical protein
MDSDLDWSDFDWSDFNSHSLGLSLNSASSFLPSTSYKSHHSLRDKIYQTLPHPKAHSVPPEIISEIFLYTVQDDPFSQTNLMLVCRYWRDIMLSTSGIHSQLRIYGWTERKCVERFGRRWLIDVIVDTQHSDSDTDDWIIEPDSEPVEFHECFMAAAEVASRWRSLALISLPPPGEYEDLQIIHPLQHLESFKLDASCELGNFLEPLITAITTSVTPRFTVMEVFHPDAALHLVQLAHFQIFSYLTTLRLMCRRMQSPVDILPSLHKLEIFDAHHLSLPNYPPTVDLPLTQILRVLHLKSVSVQWMAGRSFPALEECSVIFPHNPHALHSVYMPSCSILKWYSNNLRTLEHFHHPPLVRLEVKCGQWRTWRGSLQLATLHPIFAAQSLTCLHLEIKCSERLLAYMLGLVPALKELCMGLSSPQALSSAFFLAFAAGERNASGGPPSQAIASLCGQLKKLHLHYKRWSRGAERNALIPAFGAIVASHPAEEQVFSFRLSFGEGPDLHEWTIHEPIKRFDVEVGRDRALIGVSSPYGIVPLSRTSVDIDDLLTGLEYLRESEYLTTHADLDLPIDYFFSFHSLKEVRMDALHLEIGRNTQFSPNQPPFHTLKVLAVYTAPSSFMAGQTFHKLERYHEASSHCGDNPERGPFTEMPVCTRLIAPLSRLAALKLPHIREMDVSIDRKELYYLWERHITVNANLSGLKLLRFRAVSPDWSGITKILESLPGLETLVLPGTHLHIPFITFLQTLIPTNAQGRSGLNRSSWGDRISGVLCPRLESLQIEGYRLTDQPKLMPVLKGIITLRAVFGTPFQSFTYYQSFPEKKWELVGRDGRFSMEEVVPALQFRLDI